MPTVQVVSEVNIDLHTVLDGVARLDLLELERFASDVNSLVARRKAPYLPQQEVRLLKKINRGVAPAVRQRYTELNAKLLDQTLTQEEHNELLSLVEIIEKADTDRLKYLLELAQMRNTSLDALMDQLGIQRAIHV